MNNQWRHLNALWKAALDKCGPGSDDLNRMNDIMDYWWRHSTPEERYGMLTKGERATMEKDADEHQRKISSIICDAMDCVNEHIDTARKNRQAAIAAIRSE